MHYVHNLIFLSSISHHDLVYVGSFSLQLHIIALIYHAVWASLYSYAAHGAPQMDTQRGKHIRVSL